MFKFFFSVGATSSTITSREHQEETMKCKCENQVNLASESEQRPLRFNSVHTYL